MDKENFISFEDFKEKAIGHQTTKITDEEIMSEMLGVVAAHEGRALDENI